MALEYIARAGRDAHKHILILCRCACGREITIRKDKLTHQQTCGDCKQASVPTAAAPLCAPPAPQAAPSCAPAPQECAIASERTPEIILAELADNAAALLTMEKDIVLLSRQLAQEGVLPAGPDGDSTAKRFRETCTTAGIARKERKRLEKELRDLSGQKAVTLNSSESVLARARKRTEKL